VLQESGEQVYAIGRIVDGSQTVVWED